MESNYPAMDQQASPPISQFSNYSYFTEPARRAIDQQASTLIRQPSFNNGYFSEVERRAGYLKPELGWTQQEHFQYPRHYLHPHSHPPPHGHHHPLDMQAVIEREVEKKQIREEIIVSEIARRRVLEAEVRRELMMERELATQRGSYGFPFASMPAILFESPKRLPHLGTRLEERVLVEIIAMLLEERKRLIGMRDSGGFDTLPFQRGTADMRISEVKPVMERGKEKEKIILLAKPDENISGSKRKAVTLPGVGADEFPLDGFLKKKAKEDWSCALCQCSAFSERELNEHLRGRKHKKEAAKLQRAQMGSKNYRIGLFPKKATNCKFAAGSLPFVKTRETSSKKDYLPLSQVNPNSHSLKKNKMELVQNVQKNKKPSKKRYRAHKRSRNVSVG